MKRTLVALSLLVIQGCALGPINWNYGEVNDGAVDLSIIELISSPTAHDEQVVRVSGVISFEFEGTAIYLTEEHFKNHISENAI